jgi:hypothetical protein
LQDGGLGLLGIREFNEREAAFFAGLAIQRYRNVGQISNRGKMLPNFLFSSVVGKIPDKETD